MWPTPTLRRNVMETSPGKKIWFNVCSTKFVFSTICSAMFRRIGRCGWNSRIQKYIANPGIYRGPRIDRESINPSRIQEPILNPGDHRECRNPSWIQEPIVTSGIHRESRSVTGNFDCLGKGGTHTPSLAQGFRSPLLITITTNQCCCSSRIGFVCISCSMFIFPYSSNKKHESSKVKRSTI